MKRRNIIAALTGVLLAGSISVAGPAKADGCIGLVEGGQSGCVWWRNSTDRHEHPRLVLFQSNDGCAHAWDAVVYDFVRQSDGHLMHRFILNPPGITCGGSGQVAWPYSEWVDDCSIQYVNETVYTNWTTREHYLENFSRFYDETGC
jgi:hypothetical protein